jgi:hypothetical protein
VLGAGVGAGLRGGLPRDAHHLVGVQIAAGRRSPRRRSTITRTPKPKVSASLTKVICRSRVPMAWLRLREMRMSA